ncbi:MAG: hypothetical protein JHC33_05065 [Ignisphaera sp.]|nr:hypothetical protein [Ignisphaera sp.]
MKYQIKNITGDTTSPNAELWPAVKLYATSENGQNLLPIDAQETVFISSKAYTEFISTDLAKYISVLDADGSQDLGVPTRKPYTIAVNNTWQTVDLGRFCGKVAITNSSTTNQMQFSFSGGSGLVGSGGIPPTSTISYVLKSETVTIDTVMSPIRYMYLYGTANDVAYILAD